MSESCTNCVHKKICDLWSEQEMQRASCYSDHCFMERRKRGKWIWDANATFHNGHWICGNCRNSPPTICLTDPKIHPLEHEGYDFCGFCGADMRERRRKKHDG